MIPVTETFKLHERVQTHPATDAWMSGDRYGTVTAVHVSKGEITKVRVKLDRSGRNRFFLPKNLLHA